MCVFFYADNKPFAGWVPRNHRLVSIDPGCAGPRYAAYALPISHPGLSAHIDLVNSLVIGLRKSHQTGDRRHCEVFESRGYSVTDLTLHAVSSESKCEGSLAFMDRAGVASASVQKDIAMRNNVIPDWIECGHRILAADPRMYPILVSYNGHSEIRGGRCSC